MSIENAEKASRKLMEALGILADELSRNQSPAWDDQRDLEYAVDQVVPAIEAMVEVLYDLFEEQLQPLSKGAELDEVMSLLGKALDCEPAEKGARAASSILNVLQHIHYDVYDDRESEGEEPDVAGDAALLEEGLDAILARVPEDEEHEEDEDDEDD